MYEGKNVYVWGGGIRGRQMFDVLKKSNIPICGLIDNKLE